MSRYASRAHLLSGRPLEGRTAAELERNYGVPEAEQHWSAPNRRLRAKRHVAANVVTLSTCRPALCFDVPSERGVRMQCRMESGPGEMGPCAAAEMTQGELAKTLDHIYRLFEAVRQQLGTKNLRFQTDREVRFVIWLLGQELFLEFRLPPSQNLTATMRLRYDAARRSVYPEMPGSIRKREQLGLPSFPEFLHAVMAGNEWIRGALEFDAPEELKAKFGFRARSFGAEPRSRSPRR
jgi:hypothetical protein